MSTVLLVHGFDPVGTPWYATKLTGGLEAAGLQVRRVDFGYGEDQAAEGHCVAAIQEATTTKTPVILGDWAILFDEVEARLGSALQEYVRAGGRLAIPTSEGLLMCPVLQRLFDVPWRPSAYYRTTWGAPSGSVEALARTFPGITDGPTRRFSAKSTSVRGVAREDRCYAVCQDSQREGLMNIMGIGDDITPTSDDLDVCVASWVYGEGLLVFLGDVNCEDATVELVVAFVGGGAGANGTIGGGADPAAGAIPDEAFARCVALKVEGNELFSSEAYVEAAECYKRSLTLFTEQGPGSGAQRKLLLVLQNNRAECLIRLDNFLEAARAAEAALVVDGANPKALNRMVRAHVGCGTATSLAKAKQALAQLVAMPPAQRGKVKDLKARVRALQNRLNPPPPPNPGLNPTSSGTNPNFISGPFNMANGMAPPFPGASASATFAAATAQPPKPGAPAVESPEWMFDAYALRCDDEMTYSGTQRGIYVGNYDPDLMMRDFAVFSALAVRKGAVPSGFNWRAYLTHAAAYLQFAFEKSDAVEKYGYGAHTSLRLKADHCYGYGCMAYDDMTDAAQDELTRVCADVDGCLEDPDSEDPDAAQPPSTCDVFSRMGGEDLWREVLIGHVNLTG